MALLLLAGGGWCQAEEADSDILQMAATAATPLRGDTARRAPLSLSLTAPVAGTSFNQVPSADLGVSWRAPLASQPVDITAWRRMAPQPDAITLIQQRDPTFGARVEMALGKSRSGFTTDQRFIGMQLDNGARIGVRRTNGNPTLYYRQQF